MSDVGASGQSVAVAGGRNGTGQPPEDPSLGARPVGLGAKPIVSAGGKVAWLVGEVGAIFSMGLEAMRLGFREGFPVGEFVDQSWFLARVTTLGCILISVPFGMIIALEVGSLLLQVGAQAQLGAIMVLATVREQAPLATALLIAGAGGSAMTADLGSRVIRDEISAMQVMGINPLQRLVLPRLAAASVMAVILDGVVAISGILGGLFFAEHSLGISSASFFATFSDLSQIADLVMSLVKAAIFGLLTAMVACYKGLNAKGGSKGVGDAVNQAVVISFVLAFAVDFVLTSFYFNFIPQKVI